MEKGDVKEKKEEEGKSEEKKKEEMKEEVLRVGEINIDTE